MFDWLNRLIGRTTNTDDELLRALYAAERRAVTEIMPWGGTLPTNLRDGKPLEIVGRPTMGDWTAISAALWPRPDPARRWRLFIQEDTRP